MIVYFALFFVISVFTMNFVSKVSYENNSQKYPAIFFILLISFLILFVGLRHQVGGDWNPYLELLEITRGISAPRAMAINDPGYMLLNWIGSNIVGEIYFVNFTCALIFIYGVSKFCALLPNKYLGITCAFPYLITVVGMGYTRQSAALGFIFLSLIAIKNQSFLKFIACIIFAAAFHKTAIIFAPAAILISQSRRTTLLYFIFGAAASYLLYLLFLQHYLMSLMYGYIENEYKSSGATLRLASTLICALIFIIYRHAMNLDHHYRKFWLWISISSVVAFIGSLVIESNAFIDRLGLYLIPLQIFVLNHLPRILLLANLFKRCGTLIVILASWLQFSVWFFLSENAIAWHDYNMFPLINIL